MGETPGPDGYPAEYYKILMPHNVTSPTTLHNAVYIDNEQVAQFLDSRVILLPKPNKGHIMPQSYHPITLLNQDYKYHKILANASCHHS